jgi:hypothetical protein
MEQSVTKRWHLNSRDRGVTQKEAYDISYDCHEKTNVT